MWCCLFVVFLFVLLVVFCCFDVRCCLLFVVSRLLLSVVAMCSLLFRFIVVVLFGVKFVGVRCLLSLLFNIAVC